MYVGRSRTCVFERNSIFLEGFVKPTHYEISWKSFLWESSYSMRIDVSDLLMPSNSRNLYAVCICQSLYAQYWVNKRE